MVANLTRYTACKVHADTPERPVRIRSTDPVAAPDHRHTPSEQRAPNGDQPVRLFAWASA